MSYIFINNNYYALYIGIFGIIVFCNIAFININFNIKYFKLLI